MRTAASSTGVKVSDAGSTVISPFVQHCARIEPSAESDCTLMPVTPVCAHQSEADPPVHGNGFDVVRMRFNAASMCGSEDCVGAGACAQTLGCDGGSCTFDCAGDNSCTGAIACSSTESCALACKGTGACTGLATLDSKTKSSAACSGVSSCANAVILGAPSASLACTGLGACSQGGQCQDAGACTVSCNNGSLVTPLCCPSSGCTDGGQTLCGFVSACPM